MPTTNSLDDLSDKLSRLGFQAKSGAKHITLAYTEAHTIPQDGYATHPEYIDISSQLQESSWRLVLLHFNNETQRIEKHGHFTLMHSPVAAQPGRGADWRLIFLLIAAAGGAAIFAFGRSAQGHGDGHRAPEGRTLELQMRRPEGNA